jgi:hypothetical protein
VLFIASDKAKDMGEDEKILWPIVPDMSKTCAHQVLEGI